MKKKVREKKLSVMFVILTVFLFWGCSFGNKPNENESAAPIIDDQVKACFEEVNKFRTGNEAWYWNEGNTTKTNLVGKLKPLTLDEELCKAAKIRANEIVKVWGHTRPNGSSCFTVLQDCGIKYTSCGENIAAGNKTGSATFTQWKEDSYMYDGQGHRRNMLGDFTKIGIAYTYDSGSKYKYYWTMVLAK